ncbi:VOC family protein [Aequorivita viscosa]|nr:VOC family protein [Aequorivita viscosa]
MKIKELTLHTSQIALQKKFYGEVLGLKIFRDDENEISFKAGNSILNFLNKEISQPYHFAFNIPSNKVNDALNWLKKRVEIQKDGKAEIVDFPAWNAESIYFYDADKNILEFIARKNLNNNSQKPFSSEDILEISEIGLATTNFKEKYSFLTSTLGLEKFGGGLEVFSAIGSEHGLFILIDKTRKDWFPTNDKAFSAEFLATIEANEKVMRVEYKNERIIFEHIT